MLNWFALVPLVSSAWLAFALELTSMDVALFLPLLWLIISSINRLEAPVLEAPLQRALMGARPLVLLSACVWSGWAELHRSTRLVLSLACFVGNSGGAEDELWGTSGCEWTTSWDVEDLLGSRWTIVLWRSTEDAESASSVTVVATESEDFSKPSVAHLQNTHSTGTH